MLRKVTFFGRVIPVLILLFAMLCTTCELEGTSSASGVTDIINAKVPFITTQPAVGLALKTTDSPVTQLTVAADTEEDDGVLSYQWLRYTNPADYEDDKGAAASGTGANTANFTPPVSTDGVFYYYVRVTNTLSRATGAKTASIKSRPATVTVTDPNNAAYPSISTVSGGGVYPAPVANVTLSVTATSTDSGSVTYKWFKSDTAATTGGTEQSGTSATFSVSNPAAGTYYYYVEATNTNNGAAGRKESTVASPFTVTVVTANATVGVNAATEYQFVRGFGGMYTPWDNAPQEYLSDFERMYNPDLLGLNLLRIMIKADNVDIEQTMNDMVSGRDGDGKDQRNYYEFVKIVNKYNGYVLASPWSPPAAWKTNDDVKGGGTLRPANYENFADYLAQFCQIMYDQGAPIYVVSMQNEPTFEAKQYEGCEYTTVQHRNWWQQAGGTVVGGEARPFTWGVPGYGGGKATTRVLTMSGEAHNSVSPFHTEPTQSALQVENARRFIDVVGRHIYGAGLDSLTTAQRWGKEVWMTEHNINSGSGSYHNDSTWNYVWRFMNDVDLTIRLNQENAFIWWTAKRFYSFLGDGQNATVDGSILPRGYGMSHYAKFAKEMTRVGVSYSGTTAANFPLSGSNVNASSFGTDSTDVKITAYKSDDGKIISLVMYTPTDTNGGGGVDMGTVRIQLPSGFVIDRATAMRSSSTARGVTESVTICADRNSAIVSLPASTILSVRFIEAD